MHKTVTGTVTGTDGVGFPGVTVIEKGTTNGTTTDLDGKYSISVGDNAVLNFAFMGMQSVDEVVNNRSVINVTIEENLIGLDEVVVTALGIEKKARDLTYATQKIDGKDLTTVKNVNLINSLSGKTAGLVIGQSSSGVGGSSRVIIRGNKSISGENQPLYVIDGVPMNTSTIGQIGGGSTLAGSMDGGDAISNLNPDDIESINVLKGASASALYGSMGQNGVILITTKRGTAGVTNVEFSSSTSVESALLVPQVQGQYGSTSALDYSSRSNDPSTWGSKDNSAITSDDIKDFFRTGVTTINGLSISSGNDKSQYYMSYANTFAQGIVDKNDLVKHNFMLKGNAKIGSKITVNGSATFVNQTVKNRPFTGFENNPVGSAYLYGGKSSDFRNLKNNFETYDASRGIYVQNGLFSDYNTTSFMLDNPYWIIHRNPNELKRNCVIFSGGLSYDIADKLKFYARGSYDRVTDDFEQDIYASSTKIKYEDNGAYHTIKSTSDMLYGDAFLSYNNTELGDFSMDATLGTSHNYSKGYFQEIQTVMGNSNMYAANVFSLTNLQNNFTHTESTSEILTQSIFGTASFGYKNAVFLDVTGRQEWSSTISDKSFFYPSVGASFILTEWLGHSNIVNFAKLRATYSEVGNSLPYGVNNGKNNLAWGVSNGTLTSPTTGLTILEDGTVVELKPERSKSMEFGLDMRFLDNSVNFDLSYYRNNVENQFFAVAAPVGAYITNYYVNAGEIRNSGLEATLGYTYAKSKNFRYSTNVNFAYNKNKIISVNEDAGLDTYTVTSYGSTKIAEIRIVKDGEFGDMYTTDFSRDANGIPLLN